MTNAWDLTLHLGFCTVKRSNFLWVCAQNITGHNSERLTNTVDIVTAKMFVFCASFYDSHCSYLYSSLCACVLYPVVKLLPMQLDRMSFSSDLYSIFCTTFCVVWLVILQESRKSVESLVKLNCVSRNCMIVHIVQVYWASCYGVSFIEPDLKNTWFKNCLHGKCCGILLNSLVTRW